MRRARTRDRHLGEDAGGTGGQEQQPVGEPERLLDVVRHQQGGDGAAIDQLGELLKARASATRRASPSDSSPG